MRRPWIASALLVSLLLAAMMGVMVASASQDPTVPAAASGSRFYMVPSTGLRSLPAGAQIVETYRDYAFIASPTPPAIPGTTEMSLDLNIWGLGASFDPVLSPPAIPAGYEDPWSAHSDSEAVYGIVQYDAPIRDEWRSAGQASGVELIQPLSGFAYIARGSKGAFASIEQDSHVRWIGEYHHYYKSRGGLLEQMQLADPESEGLFWMYVFDQDKAEVRSIVDSIIASGGRIHLVWQSEQWPVSIQFYAKWKEIDDLLKWRGVYTLEPYEMPRVFNDQASWALETDVTNSRTIFDKGITGEGVILAVADTGATVAHTNFATQPNKIVRYWPCANNKDDGGYHGSHVSGTVLGNGGSATAYDATSYDGMSFRSLLSVQDTSNDGSSISCGTPSRNAAEAKIDGARVEQNSWGGSCNGGYGSSSQDADQYMWSNPDFLLSFSNGNSGPSAGTVCSPATAKNVLSVGATAKGGAKTMASFSSRGPTDDGRIKPTIMAPGSSTQSVNGGGTTGYTSMSGTSMSGPAAAGMNGLTIQYFVEGWYPRGTKGTGISFYPSAAMMKSIIVASGLDMKAAGGNPANNIPDQQDQGFGKIKLEDVLYFSGEARKMFVIDTMHANFTTPGLKTGEKKDFKVNVTAGQALKIALVWTDYPGSNLVNNLNLLVTSPSVKLYAGNDFTAGESKVGGGIVDSRNVEEIVYIKAPETGEYTISVSAPTVSQGTSQNYALIASGDLAGSIGPGIARIDVTPTSASIDADSTQQFSAQAIDTNGNATNATFYWSAGSGSIAQTGLYTPGRAGTFTVWANASGQSGTATVRVTPGKLAAVRIDPATLTIAVGRVQQYTAFGTDAKGNNVQVNVSWNASVGTITAAGSYTAPTKVGSDTVTATDLGGSGLKASGSVTVTGGAVATLAITPLDPTVAADATQQFDVQGFDQFGNPTPTNAIWSASAGAISPTGLYTPDKVGTFTITARDGSVSASTGITVVAGALSSITVEPKFVSITADETARFSAKGADSKGNPVSITATWTSSTGGSIANDGTFTPQRVGTFTVTATASSISSTGAVEVRAGRLSKLLITPAEVSISADSTQGFAASGEDAKGNPVPLASLSWNAEDGRITGTGTTASFKPQKVGNWKVTATQDTVSGEAVVTVTPGKITTVRVDPPTAEILDGETMKFTATAFDLNENAIPDAKVEWSLAAKIGTIGTDGTFTATKSGEGRVVAKATSDGLSVSGEAAIRVKALPIDLALYRAVGGQINFFLILVVLLGLVGGLLALMIHRQRRKKWKQEYDHALQKQYQQGEMYQPPGMGRPEPPGGTGSVSPQGGRPWAPPTESVPTGPAPAGSAPTEPAPTEPVPTESTPAQSAPTEPASAKPVPAESPPTEPAPTGSAPPDPR